MAAKGKRRWRAGGGAWAAGDGGSKTAVINSGRTAGGRQREKREKKEERRRQADTAAGRNDTGRYGQVDERLPGLLGGREGTHGRGNPGYASAAINKSNISMSTS